MTHGTDEGHICGRRHKKRKKEKKYQKCQKRCQKELVVATCPQSVENKAFGERPKEPGRDKLSIEGSQ